MADKLDYALLANRVYGRDEVNRTPLPDEWQEIGLQSDDKLTGFSAGIYRSSTEIVISFAGTNERNGRTSPWPIFRPALAFRPRR